MDDKKGETIGVARGVNLDSILGCFTARALECSSCGKVWIYSKPSEEIEDVQDWRSPCCKKHMSRQAKLEWIEVVR